MGWKPRPAAAGSRCWLLGGECPGWRKGWRMSRCGCFSNHWECPLQPASLDASIQTNAGAPWEHSRPTVLARPSGQGVFPTRQKTPRSQKPGMVDSIPLWDSQAFAIQATATERSLFELSFCLIFFGTAHLNFRGPVHVWFIRTKLFCRCFGPLVWIVGSCNFFTGVHPFEHKSQVEGSVP